MRLYGAISEKATIFILATREPETLHVLHELVEGLFEVGGIIRI
jgi:hypothetical protein